MPSHYCLNTTYYDFWAKPVGVRKYLKFLPYFSGGFLRFNLFAYDKHKRGKTLSYKWRLQRLHDDKYSLYDNKTGLGYFNTYLPDYDSTFGSELVIPAVSASGQYKMQLMVNCEDYAIMPWETIIDFEQLSRDSFTIQAMIAGAGILGVVIGVLLGWWLSNIPK